MSEKIKITISGVKDLLSEGKSRKEIAEHYGVPMSVMKEKVWSHPELKNLKAKKGHNIELIDDTVEDFSQEAKEEAYPVSEMEQDVPQVPSPEYQNVLDAENVTEEVQPEEYPTQPLQEGTSTQGWK